MEWLPTASFSLNTGFKADIPPESNEEIAFVHAVWFGTVCGVLKSLKCGKH